MSQVYILLLRWQYYEQLQRPAMGFPLSPGIANSQHLLTGRHMLDSARLKSTLFYRYLEDTFVIWPHRQELQAFFQYPDLLHNYIQFIMEVEENAEISFLSVLVSQKSDRSLGHLLALYINNLL